MTSKEKTGQSVTNSKRYKLAAFISTIIFTSIAGMLSCGVNVSGGNPPPVYVAPTPGTAPVITTAPLLNAAVNALYAYVVSATDLDDPAASLTWVKSAGDTCPGSTLANNGDGTATYNFTPTVPDADTTCVMAIEVCDPVVQCASQMATITIAPLGTPLITTTASTSATEFTLYTYAAAASDTDTPAASLTWAKSGADTCAGSILTDNGDGTADYAFMPAGGTGGTACVLAIEVCDPTLNCSSETRIINIAILVSFAVDVQPIFANCFCHVPGPTSGLSLDTYANVMAGGDNNATNPEIVPGDPANSLLTKKIDWSSPPPVGGDMPPFGAELSAGDQQTIWDWISQGALDN